jgi:hypothetical protein
LKIGKDLGETLKIFLSSLKPVMSRAINIKDENKETGNLLFPPKAPWHIYAAYFALLFIVLQNIFVMPAVPRTT